MPSPWPGSSARCWSASPSSSSASSPASSSRRPKRKSMPLIPVIGRRQPKMRLLIALLYTVLSLGAVTMVYPFVVMIGTSFTSPVDHDEFRPIPAYLTDDTWLFRKYVEAKYNEDIPKFNAQLSNDVATFKDLMPP